MCFSFIGHHHGLTSPLLIKEEIPLLRIFFPVGIDSFTLLTADHCFAGPTSLVPPIQVAVFAQGASWFISFLAASEVGDDPPLFPPFVFSLRSSTRVGSPESAPPPYED